MNPKILYRFYVTGERHVVGYVKNGEPFIFTDDKIEELKKLSEDAQEKYALKIESE